MRKAAAFALAALVAGCGPKDTDPGPGGVTVAEAKALDQAAEMLEQRRLPAAATEERPAASPSPGSAPAQPAPAASRAP